MSLRSNLATSHVPVVMLTAMGMDEERLKGLTTGADAYIVKPFNMEILRQTIVNLIQRTRTLRLKYEHTDQLEGKTKPDSIKSPDEKLLANIMKAINDHLDDENLTMDLIASEVGLSRVHLHRKMKDLTGQTPHDFIRKVRLKKAAELLASGKMNVSEVTYSCGFSSPTSFSALFKKFYGVAPSQYYKSKNE
jgi:AraC-like DNA-binding protein